MLLSETQVKVNVRIYFCFFPLDLYVFCLPSDLLRRSSAVVIEQAQCLYCDNVIFQDDIEEACGIKWHKVFDTSSNTAELTCTPDMGLDKIRDTDEINRRIPYMIVECVELALSITKRLC